jgi:hypothetical protein
LDLDGDVYAPGSLGAVDALAATRKDAKTAAASPDEAATPLR